MEFKAKDKTSDYESPDSVQADLLETFDYEYAGKKISIVSETSEFTSVCPYSGLPDFGTLRIEYVPREKILELRSLKYYLLAYRNVGVFYEHLVNRILDDLVSACSPEQMTVTLQASPRGGIRTTVTARHPRRTPEESESGEGA